MLSEMLLSRAIVCLLMSTGFNELDQPENQPKTASNVSGSESKVGLNNILQTITSPVAIEKSLTYVGGHCSPRLRSHGSAFRAPWSSCQGCMDVVFQRRTRVDAIGSS